MLELLRGLVRADHRLLVLVTHSVEAARYADRVLRIEGGLLEEGVA